MREHALSDVTSTIHEHVSTIHEHVVDYKVSNSRTVDSIDPTLLVPVT